ncbi:MAG: hypothetical protein CMJ78_21245 [Planctomycetaceae bacterium]|nr:hypothetical protein [Planctomycetaceae bacterium]
MEQGFPPDAPWNTTPLALHVYHAFLVSMLIAAVVFFVVSLRRNVSSKQIWLWGSFAFLVPIFMTAAFIILHQFIRFEIYRVRFNWLFVELAWGISAVALVVSHVRLKRAKQRSAFYPVFVAAGLYACFLLLPTLSTPIEGVNRNQCRNNLKQIGIGLSNYESVAQSFPQASMNDPLISWRVAILPQTYESETHKQYNSSLPWDHAQNLPVAQTRVQMYQCPSRERRSRHTQDLQHRYFTDYVMLTGPGTMSPAAAPTRYRDYKDGASNTVGVVEASGLNIVWTEPRDFDVAKQPIGVNLIGPDRYSSPGMMSSYHRQGAHVLLMDGTVRYFNEKIDPSVLKALTTINAGDEVDWEWHFK